MLGLLLFRRIAREVGAAAHRITLPIADQSDPRANQMGIMAMLRGAPPRPVLRERAGVRAGSALLIRHSKCDVGRWAFAFSPALEMRTPNAERRTPNSECRME